MATIREYHADDLDAVVRLSLDAWAPVFDSIREVAGPELFVRFYGDDWRTHQAESVETVVGHAAQVWVAEVDGAVAGFVAVAIRADQGLGEIGMLAVAPEHQRGGLGEALTDIATDWIRDAGMPVAMVETGGDPGHGPARRTYERAGYTLWPVARYFKAL